MGSRIWSMMRLASLVKSRRPLRSELTTTNSSPPIRATKSSSRTLARSTSAACCSMASPEAGAVLGRRGGSFAQGLCGNAAVGERGQRVVERGVLDAGGGLDELGIARLGLGPGPFQRLVDADVVGDIPVATGDADAAVDIAIAGADGAAEALRSVRQDDAELRDVAAAMADGVVELDLGARTVVGMERIAPVPPGAQPAILWQAVEGVHAVVPDQAIGIHVVVPD